MKSLKLVLVLFTSLFIMSCETTEVSPKNDIDENVSNEAGELAEFIGSYVLDSVELERSEYTDEPGIIFTSENTYCNNSDQWGYSFPNFEIYENEGKLFYDENYWCNDVERTGEIDIENNILISFYIQDSDNRIKRKGRIQDISENNITIKWTTMNGNPYTYYSRR